MGSRATRTLYNQNRRVTVLSKTTRSATFLLLLIQLHENLGKEREARARYRSRKRKKIFQSHHRQLARRPLRSKDPSNWSAHITVIPHKPFCVIAQLVDESVPVYLTRIPSDEHWPLLMLYNVVPAIFDTQGTKLLELSRVQRSLVSLETARTFDAVRNVKERQPR